MNRYPIWKYLVIATILVIAALYTLPNFFGEAPAVQVSSLKAMAKIDAATVTKVQEALKAAGVNAEEVALEGNSVRARFDSPDNQLKAKDAIQKALIADPADPGYIVALNLVSRSPAWLRSVHAMPMYLGLDLRGGVHFMLQVDMQAALTKRADSLAGDLRLALREKTLRYEDLMREGTTIQMRLPDVATAETGDAAGARAVCRPANAHRGRRPQAKTGGQHPAGGSAQGAGAGAQAKHHHLAQPHQ